jgi:hypothetical protein
MNVTLERDIFGNEWTQGKLYIDGAFFCYTLEDRDRWLESKTLSEGKVYGKTAIPRGKYVVQLTHSNRFRKILPLLLDVPNFTGIRIHAGNTHADTDGCILLGMDRTRNGTVTQSQVAMSSFMKLMENNKDKVVTIEVK